MLQRLFLLETDTTDPYRNLAVEAEVAIKKYYPDFSLDVNFYTEKGILGVLGASGCGKSIN